MSKVGPRYTAQVVWVTTPDIAGELRYWAKIEDQRLSAFLRRVARAGLTRTRKALHAKHGQPVWADVNALAELSVTAGKKHAQLGWMDEPAFVGELRYWAVRENVSLSDLLSKVMIQGMPSVRARLVRAHGEPASTLLDTYSAAAVSQNRWARFRRGETADPRDTARAS